MSSSSSLSTLSLSSDSSEILSHSSSSSSSNSSSSSSSTNSSSSSYSSASTLSTASSSSSSSYIVAIEPLIVTGFGDTNANGTYTYYNHLDGHAQYVKGNYRISFHSSYMPISDAPAYYIIYISSISSIVGDKQIEVPKYINHGSSVTGGTWHGIRDQNSLENNTDSANIVHV